MHRKNPSGSDPEGTEGEEVMKLKDVTKQILQDLPHKVASNGDCAGCDGIGELRRDIGNHLDLPIPCAPGWNDQLIEQILRIKGLKELGILK